MSEIRTDGAAEAGRALPRLRYAAFNEWLQAHADQIETLFPEQQFAPDEPIFDKRLTGDEDGARPLALFVVSGEVMLTQVLPGSVDPCKALYQGHVWVHPRGLSNDPSTAHLTAHLKAATACRVRMLSRRTWSSMSVEDRASLHHVLDTYAEFSRVKHAFFSMLRKTEQLKNVRVRHLMELLELVDVRSYKKGQHIIEEGQSWGKGAYLVLRGLLAEHHLPPGTQVPEGAPKNWGNFSRALYPGSFFGDALLHSDEHVTSHSTVEVHSDEATVAFISQELSAQLARRFPLLARLMGKAPMETWPASLGPPLPGGFPPEVVVFRSSVGVASEERLDGPALGVMVDLVAEGIRQAHGDLILVVDVVAGRDELSPRCPAPKDAEGREVTHHRISASSGAAAARMLQEMAEQDDFWDYLFVRVDPSLWSGLCPPEGSEPGFAPTHEGGIAWKLVQLVSRTAEMRLVAGFEPSATLYTVLLGRKHRKEDRPDPAGTVRIRLEPRHLTQGTRLAALTEQEKASVQRWGRAITERLVGVALGGGGSWGFAEMAIIQRMREQGIPIDLVSGTSFGALAGAFFANQGEEGLKQLEKQSPTVLTWVARVSILSSRAIAWYVDIMNGRRRLEETEIPFFPVATNVSTSQVFISQWGSMGEGVQASGALSGVFSPAFRDGCRIVDGGFIANVPAAILKTHRANLIVGINVVSSPPIRSDSKPLLPGRVGLFLHGLNPFERIGDVIRSMLIVFHTSGNQSALGADVIVNPVTSSTPWDYANPDRIIQEAYKTSGPAVAEIQKKWDEMRLPRRARLSDPSPFPQEVKNAAAG
jgi:predicted acylesterase/phospholipase RssA